MSNTHEVGISPRREALVRQKWQRWKSGVFCKKKSRRHHVNGMVSSQVDQSQ